MLLDHVKPPLSLNCDFEKAIHLAANNIFENCSIYGCFFHLSQNWYKRLGKLSLNKYFFSQKEFRKGFKMCQSLAYLPVNEVGMGFEDLIENFSDCNYLKPFFEYIEKNYIGRKDDVGKRNKGRFPIKTWNLHLRVLNNKPTTNNVESWHSCVTNDVRSHPTINTVISEIRLEQAKTHSSLVRLDSGEEFLGKKKKKDKIKLEHIRKMIIDYHTFSSRLVFLESMSVNMGSDDLKV